MSKTNISYPMQGIEVWRNSGNRFLVFQSHYTADPIKRDPKYIDGIKASMPIHKFRQEYELVWDSFVGMPVFPDWNREHHGSKTTIHPHLGLPLLLGIDQGLHPAAVVCQLQEWQLVVLKEYTAHNKGAERFKEQVSNSLRVDFPEWTRFGDDYIMGMDPSAFNRRDTDERTYASIWAKEFKPQPGAMLWEPRRESVEQWLTKSRKGESCIKVSLPDCPVLVEGFEGGYRYPESNAEIEPLKIRPIKDKYSQVHDALQYILTLLRNKSKIKKGRIPAPAYSWGVQNGR